MTKKLIFQFSTVLILSLLNLATPALLASGALDGPSARQLSQIFKCLDSKLSDAEAPATRHLYGRGRLTALKIPQTGSCPFPRADVLAWLVEKTPPKVEIQFLFPNDSVVVGRRFETTTDELYKTSLTLEIPGASSDCKLPGLVEGMTLLNSPETPTQVQLMTWSLSGNTAPAELAELKSQTQGFQIQAVVPGQAKLTPLKLVENPLPEQLWTELFEELNRQLQYLQYRWPTWGDHHLAKKIVQTCAGAVESTKPDLSALKARAAWNKLNQQSKLLTEAFTKNIRLIEFKSVSGAP